MPTFKRPSGKKPFEKIMGKGEIAGNQHFPLFPQWFLVSKTDIIDEQKVM